MQILGQLRTKGHGKDIELWVEKCLPNFTQLQVSKKCDFAHDPLFCRSLAKLIKIYRIHCGQSLYYYSLLLRKRL